MDSPKKPSQRNETFCPTSKPSTCSNHLCVCSVLEHRQTQQKRRTRTVLEHRVHPQTHSTRERTNTLIISRLEIKKLWHATKSTPSRSTLTHVACHTQARPNSLFHALWRAPLKAHLGFPNSSQKALALPTQESLKKRLFSLQEAVLRPLLSFLALECGAKVLHSAVPQKGFSGVLGVVRKTRFQLFEIPKL